VPRVAPDAGPWILEWLELQVMAREPQRITQRQEPVAIGADHVHQWLSLPDVTMEPESAVHGMDHPVLAPNELATPMGYHEVTNTAY
jgi:hypothetical protein